MRLLKDTQGIKEKATLGLGLAWLQELDIGWCRLLLPRKEKLMEEIKSFHPEYLRSEIPIRHPSGYEKTVGYMTARSWKRPGLYI